jgi:ribose-phosphate pyrophosphokinase
VPISARLVADLLEAAGIHRCSRSTCTPARSGFFSVPVDHLFAGPVVMIDYLRKKDLRDPVIVAPDAGGVERARAMASDSTPGWPSSTSGARDRARRSPCTSSATSGSRRGGHRRHHRHRRHLTQAGTAFEREGARRIMACGVHAVLSGPAIDRIAASPIEEVVVTNSIPLSETKRATARITVLTVAPLLGEAIRRIHDEESVSTLFA